jgi:hypothetical protein
MEGVIVDKADMKEQDQESKGCPYINDDIDECYVSKLTSANMEKALHYCLDNHKACETYIRLRENEKQVNKR